MQKATPLEKIDLDFEEEKATPCDHVVRFDAGYAFIGDADEEDGRAELLTESGESVSYDIVFTYCPKCGKKLEEQNEKEAVFVL